MLEWCGAANKTASCSANRSGALLCQTEKISRTYNKAEIRREVRRVYTLKGSESVEVILLLSTSAKLAL